MAVPINNASSRLASAHMAGSDALVLLPGEGERFGDPAPDDPIRVTAVARSTLVNGQIAPTSVYTIFLCTGRSGDTLTGLSATEGTADQNYFRNDPVAALITAGSLLEVQGDVANAVKTTEEYDDPEWLRTLAPEKVIGLPDALAAKADDSTVVKKAGASQSVSALTSFTSTLGAPKVNYGTQGGTIGTPAPHTLWEAQPRDPAFGLWETLSYGSNFSGIWDPVLYISNNAHTSPNARDSLPSFGVAFEANYFEPSTAKYTAESYIEFVSPVDDGANRFQRRPWGFTLDKATGSTRFVIETGPSQANFGSFTVVGGPATGGSFQMFAVTAGASAATSSTSVLTPLTVSQNATFSGSVAIPGNLAAGTLTASDTFIGSDSFGGVCNLIIGTAMRQNNRHVLLGRNLRGVNGSDSYATNGTGTVGYQAIELRDGGTMQFYAASGATTAGAVVTPTARLTISGSTGGVTTSGLLSAAGGISVGGGATVSKILRASAALNFGSIAAGASASMTISVTGATAGSEVALGPPAAGVEAGLCIEPPRVSAADTVTVTLTNTTASPIDPASATYRVTVFNP